MLWTIFLIGLLLVKTMYCEEPVPSLNKTKKIVVAFSERVPFVVLDRRLSGLDISIIENFARKLSIQVELLKYNTSLIELFNHGEDDLNFLQKR